MEIWWPWNKNRGVKNSDDSDDKDSQKWKVVRIFGAWISAFFLLEPLTSLLILNDKDNVTMLTLMTDFVYSSICFLHSVYIFKHIFHKPEYFPTHHKDLPLFIAIYVVIQFTLDCIWLLFTGHVKVKYPLYSIFQRYEKVKKVAHSVNVITYGIIWINITYFFYQYVRPLEWISTVIASLFIMLLLHHKPVVDT